MSEVWKDILGCNGRYQISNFGNVKSIFTYKDESQKVTFLKKNLIQGYESVYLKFGEKRKFIGVHILVAQEFIGPRPKNMVVDHIDGNKINNNYKNLQYLSHRDNIIKGKSSDLRISKASRYVGVTYQKNVNKWRARIKHLGRQVSLGLYFNQEDAYKAYMKYRKDKRLV